MHSLPIFLRLAGRTVLVAGHGAAADAKRRLVAEAGGVVTSTPLSGRSEDVCPAIAGRERAMIAFVAIEDPVQAAAVAAELRAAGLLVNVVDQPALCDFTVPAIVDRSPVLVAIGSDGASASLAKALKERLETIVPPALGALARAILASRPAVAAVHGTVAARRLFWARLLAPGGALDPLGDVADVGTAIAAALAAPGDTGGPGDTVNTISTVAMPASVDTLTLADLRVLAQADWVLHPADAPAALLAFVRRDAQRAIGTALPDPLPAGRGVLILRGA
jgi:uroporphyrin-III C-methyltransferase / precorrin-2 dehydrogenase / sirohydrochlorin ferrochelatase